MNLPATLGYDDLHPGCLFTVLESAMPLVAEHITVHGDDRDDDITTEMYGAADVRLFGLPIRLLSKQYPFVIGEMLNGVGRVLLDLRMVTLMAISVDYALALLPRDTSPEVMHNVAAGAQVAEQERQDKAQATEVQEIAEQDKSAKWPWRMFKGVG